MIAVGIDLGGTKVEAQLFDERWQIADRRRDKTPGDYQDLVHVMADLIGWADQVAGRPLPVGVAAAGLVNPTTGLVLTANLSASGHPFPADIASVARPVRYENDCRAMALSEAKFGAGIGHRVVMSLILGTGTGGGICVDGEILEGSSKTGGEFGHTSAPAHIVTKYGLPIVRCGCGRDGCVETLIAGPGLSRIAHSLTGQELSPAEIAQQKSGAMSEVWKVWCELVGDLLRNLTLAIDPDIVLLGGGISRIAGVAGDLEGALRSSQFPGFAIPKIALAEGGDASGGRGAAFAAWQEAQNV